MELRREGARTSPAAGGRSGRRGHVPSRLVLKERPNDVSRELFDSTLAGCADQTIHADTAHLFSFTEHLPPHYLNLFLPAATTQEGDESDSARKMGQTAFVVGTHRLELSAKVMANKDGLSGLQELLQRLVRPHLQVGDALLFDCRVLHFGLANQNLNRHLRPATADLSSIRNVSNDSSNNNNSTLTSKVHPMDGESQEVWRPMLYVNYHQSWFRDPKNWNDAVKLF